MLEEREAFLRAIFDTPDDDTPRLVYADWLEEHGFPHHAGLIRVQCELAGREPGDRPSPEIYQRQAELIRAVNAIDLPAVTAAFPNRGFRFVEELSFLADELLHPSQLRQTAAISRPEWFGAMRLRVHAGTIDTDRQVATMFELPCFGRVTALDLSGKLRPINTLGRPPGAIIEELVRNGPFPVVPVVTEDGLERLVRHPGVGRLRSLFLYNNDLDSRAIPILLGSPHLGQLRELGISRGNRLGGRGWRRLIDMVRSRAWRQLAERFGESVVN